IGGAGIGPLAMISQQGGYDVSGSDFNDSRQLLSFHKKRVNNINLGQLLRQIADVHRQNPINWFVYSSALPNDHPELEFCKKNGIKVTKRDELLNEILSQKKLKMIAVAGTHGKTTTTAMLIWLFKELGQPISYSVGAKISYGEMGEFNSKSRYF